MFSYEHLSIIKTTLSDGLYKLKCTTSDEANANVEVVKSLERVKGFLLELKEEL